MKLARNIAGAVVGAVLIAMAACATTTTTATRPSGLSDSAAKLDMGSRALAARSDSVGPPYQQDAHELARRAYDFHSMVNTATVSNEDVKSQFELVSQTYHKLRADVDHAGTQQAHSDLQPVTAAYRSVEHDMGVTPAAGTGD